MRTPVIVSYGYTKISEHWNKDVVSLAFDAANVALKKIKGRVDRVDAIYVGNMNSSAIGLQGHLGAFLASELGLEDTPAVTLEAAGASGSYAIAEAACKIRCGACDFVLAGGVEKLSDVLPDEAYQALNLAEDTFIMNTTGLTSAGLNAILMRLYMDRYRVPREKISYLAVQDHANAVAVEHAQYRSPITLEQVLSAPPLADPITLFDAFGIGDGAAFTVITSKDIADNLGLEYVEIAGIGISTNSLSIGSRKDPLWFYATEKAFSKALKEANIAKELINVLEIHDEYTITGVLALESLGMYERGRAAHAVFEGETSLKGKLPINTFGGLKARGNPFGATGAYQVIEVCMQILGRAGPNQVANVKYGAVHNMGGLDNTSVVIVLKRGER